MKNAVYGVITTQKTVQENDDLTVLRCGLKGTGADDVKSNRGVRDTSRGAASRCVGQPRSSPTKMNQPKKRRGQSRAQFSVILTMYPLGKLDGGY